MTPNKTGEQLLAEVTERLLERSESSEDEHHRVDTFYYPQADGTVGFSRYLTAKTEGEVSMHASGVLTGQEAAELRKKHPEWFAGVRPLCLTQRHTR